MYSRRYFSLWFAWEASTQLCFIEEGATFIHAYNLVDI
jgi:hypothetical protein